MSVESLVITALVEEGTPKPAYQQGINKNDFEIMTDEFEWIERRFEKRKPITRRTFRERFDDFEYIVPKENIDDLLIELKEEKAYSQIAALIETAATSLLPENAIQTAEQMREVLGDTLKTYSPHSDIDVQDFGSHLEKIKQHRVLAKAGHTVGMPTLIPTIDYHWDGLLPGRLIGVLGRPGEGKSFFITYIAWLAIKSGYKIGLFSPEMDEFEHRCRLHTLASADKEVQEACGLKRGFKNRDLMRGVGFNMRSYEHFGEYFDNLPGKCFLFTRKYRSSPMTPQYVASRVADLGLHGVIADPLSKLRTLGKRKDNPVWEAYDKVGAFQELGEEHGIFTIATNWSTRQQGRSKSEKAPDLDESFGSDALAQEADHIIGVKHDPEDKTLTLRCTKSRFGKPKFTSVIDFHPNTGFWQEINIDHEVMSYRLSLNGKAKQNGTTGKVPKIIQGKATRMNKAKPAKALPKKAKPKKATRKELNHA
jgi:hypothetical protein